MSIEDARSGLARYPLLQALIDRRSRRFGRGMKIGPGPLAFSSRRKGVPLTEEEEALLAFAACGVTGPALVDLDYGPGQGGTILAGLQGRTIASADAIHTVSVIVSNAEATYLLKRPRDFAPEAIPDLVSLARGGRFTELFRRSRIRIADGRVEAPLRLPYNLSVNHWSLYDPASTYFLPINELTFLHINGVLTILDEPNRCFIVDERAGFRPAGLRRFARSRGGRLHDDPADERIVTVQQLDTLVTELATIEQGMVLQNLGLMTQAMGLGGFPHYAAHPWGWLEALGFRTRSMPASRYLGMGRLLSTVVRMLGKDVPSTIGLGLERDGEPLLTAYCPPYFPTMEAAVRAVVDFKFGRDGVYRAGTRHTWWRDPNAVAAAVEPHSADAIGATIAYCSYIYDRYGRFPAYQQPFRTVLGFQAGHVDPDFYERHYRPEALTDTQRRHMQDWHGAD